jgi:hypothetical protein
MKRQIKFKQNGGITKEEVERLEKAKDLLLKAKSFEHEEIISLGSCINFLELLSTQIRRILKPFLESRTNQVCSGLLNETKVALEKTNSAKKKILDRIPALLPSIGIQIRLFGL